MIQVNVAIGVVCLGRTDVEKLLRSRPPNSSCLYTERDKVDLVSRPSLPTLESLLPRRTFLLLAMLRPPARVLIRCI